MNAASLSPRLGVAVVVRAAGVDDPLQRQVPGLVVGRDAGEAGGGQGQPVVAAEARDDLLLLRSAAQVVVVADQLDVGVVGVRARAAEEHLGEVAGASPLAEEREHPVGEPDRRLVRGRAEQVVVAQLLDRLPRRLSDLGPAVADVDAPEPGAAVDVLPAAAIHDPHPPALAHDQRPDLEVLGDRGVGMEQALPVHLLERIVGAILEHSPSRSGVVARAAPAQA